jgi:hypothetical protein
MSLKSLFLQYFRNWSSCWKRRLVKWKRKSTVRSPASLPAVPSSFSSSLSNQQSWKKEWVHFFFNLGFILGRVKVPTPSFRLCMLTRSKEQGQHQSVELWRYFFIDCLTWLHRIGKYHLDLFQHLGSFGENINYPLPLEWNNTFCRTWKIKEEIETLSLNKAENKIYMLCIKKNTECSKLFKPQKMSCYVIVLLINFFRLSRLSDPSC